MAIFLFGRNILGFNGVLSAKIRLLSNVLTIGLVFAIAPLSAFSQEKPERRDGEILYRGHAYNSRIAPGALPTEQAVRNYVMGPLEMVTDWDKFATSLRTLKESGVEAITTDIWWGLVQPEKGRFQWDYYKRYAEVVKKSGLHWLPILSFHQAGGNVGDNVDIPIPKWVWNEASDMKFTGSNGFVNGEYISFWTQEAYPLYEAVMKSFSENFAAYDDTIAKIYLSLGPAGELRFPSYNAAAGWNYPDVGYLQSYSERAKSSFRKYLQQKYDGDIAKLNAAWSLNFSGFEDSRIQPPGDGLTFFKDGVKSNYGRDFLAWYQGTLEEHAKKMFELGNKNLRNPFFSLAKFEAPLGGKIAGIHWKMGDPVYTRGAEYAAGYVEYGRLLEIFSDARVELTFTCMEMYDNNQFPAFSKPEQLVKGILKLAVEKGVRVNGENALAISNNPAAYEQIRRVFEKGRLQGFTLLRLGQLVENDGKANAEFHAYQQQVIRSRLQHFLVRTHLDAAEVQAKGYEIRIIGNTSNLGDGKPAKGLALTPAGGGDWTGSVAIPNPESLSYDVVLYNPESGHIIHEAMPIRTFRGQSDRLFIDTLFAKVVPMGPTILLKTSELKGPSCSKVFGF